MKKQGWGRKNGKDPQVGGGLVCSYLPPIISGFLLFRTAAIDKVLI